MNIVKGLKRKSTGEVWYDHAGNECFYRENGTISCRTINEEPSATIQSEKDKLDLEYIKSIYNKTGVMNNVNPDNLRYGDFTANCDYHTAVLRVQEAEEDFMSLPAELRVRFSNDPGKLIDFVRNPNNAAEAVKLGLLKAPAVAPQDSQVPQGASAAPPSPGG